MPVAETTTWGREFLWPDYDNGDCDGMDGWLSRIAFPDPEEAITEAAKHLEVPRERIELKPVLMREQSEVEAKIMGLEYPAWVECTKRARSYEPFWRVRRLDPSEANHA